MTRLAFVCGMDSDPVGSEEHDTQILIARCLYCARWTITGYRCGCGHVDTDPLDSLPGHGPGECVDGAS